MYEVIKTRVETDLLSPGISWYETSVAERPAFAPLDGDCRADVAIIGGGFTGLSAACHLAKNGVSVVLVDERRFGDGASGRNGGQFGTGQRRWVDELEKQYGFERTKALFDLAEGAKSYLHTFAQAEGFDMDYRQGQMSVVHKPRHLSSYRAHVETMARYGYTQLTFMDRDETAQRLGSPRFYGGIRDLGTGHIHPLKLVVGTAKAAARYGARLHEKTSVKKINRINNEIIVQTERGTITAQRVLLATNGYGGKIDAISAARVLPIRSYIGATIPLDIDVPVLPGGEAVDDSRFVVRYFRKTIDNRLLFGGSEAYGVASPKDMRASVHRQLTEIYPALANIDFTHVWGGTVAITVERMPLVREVSPYITYCGGYSGHGVMLSHYFGKLYAESIIGNKDYLQLMKDLKISVFPGGFIRTPLLFLAMNWFSLLDRI